MLCGMWDLSISAIEPVSPALVGRFSTPEPPGEPCILPFKIHLTLLCFFFQCIYSSFNGIISSFIAVLLVNSVLDIYHGAKPEIIEFLHSTASQQI